MFDDWAIGPSWIRGTKEIRMYTGGEKMKVNLFKAMLLIAALAFVPACAFAQAAKPDAQETPTTEKSEEPHHHHKPHGHHGHCRHCDDGHHRHGHHGHHHEDHHDDESQKTEPKTPSR